MIYVEGGLNSYGNSNGNGRGVMGNKSDYTESFGEWLRETRQERRLTLRQLADASGVDFAAISKIELGQREPDADAVIALAVALGEDILVSLRRAGIDVGRGGLNANEDNEAQSLEHISTRLRRMAPEERIRMLETIDALLDGFERAKARNRSTDTPTPRPAKGKA